VFDVSCKVLTAMIVPTGVFWSVTHIYCPFSLLVLSVKMNTHAQAEI
jgi:hypothetical protein